MEFENGEKLATCRKLEEFLAKSHEFIVAEYKAEKEQFEQRGGNTKEDPAVKNVQFCRFLHFSDKRNNCPQNPSGKTRQIN
jgi:hypothetical protein